MFNRHWPLLGEGKQMQLTGFQQMPSDRSGFHVQFSDADGRRFRKRIAWEDFELMQTLTRMVERVEVQFAPLPVVFTPPPPAVEPTITPAAPGPSASVEEISLGQPVDFWDDFYNQP